MLKTGGPPTTPMFMNTRTSAGPQAGTVMMSSSPSPFKSATATFNPPLTDDG